MRRKVDSNIKKQDKSHWHSSTNSMAPHRNTLPTEQPGHPPKLKKAQGCLRGRATSPRFLPQRKPRTEHKTQNIKHKTRGTGNHTPIIFLLITKATPAVSVSAIQNACHTPTAPKMRLKIKAAGRMRIR